MCLVGATITFNAFTLATLIKEVPEFTKLIFTPTEERYEERSVERLDRYIYSRRDGLLPSERHESSSRRVYTQAYRAHHHFLYLLTPVWIYLARNGGAGSIFPESISKDAIKTLIENSTTIFKHIIQGSFPFQALIRDWHFERTNDLLYAKWIEYGGFPAFVIGTVHELS